MGWSWAVLFSGCAVLAGCSQPTVADTAVPAGAALVSCQAATDGAAPKERAALAEWRAAVENGPLYAAAARASAASCRTQLQTGAVALEYRFDNGGWLRARRDEALESSEQEARFGKPSAQDPQPLLLQAERAAFGEAGCGLDWQKAETQADKDSTETVYRGKTCSCQARVRRNDAGQVLGVSLRSAC
jgi:hypothetical protein